MTKIDRSKLSAVTCYCVGGYPAVGSESYWVVQHSSGAKRWTWTAKERDRIMEAFEYVDEWVVQDDYTVQSLCITKRTAFEITLMGLERRNKKQYGWKLELKK